MDITKISQITNISLSSLHEDSVILNGDLTKHYPKEHALVKEWFESGNKIDEIDLTKLLENAKEAKYEEVNKKRDQKILEDSTRYTEAETAKSNIDALTTVEEIESFDIETSFS
jgi:hypothetical protein